MYDVGVFSRPDSAGALYAVLGPLGKDGQQASVEGAHTRAVLYLPPRFNARVVGSPIVWLREISPHLDHSYLVIPASLLTGRVEKLTVPHRHGRRIGG